VVFCNKKAITIKEVKRLKIDYTIIDIFGKNRDKLKGINSGQVVSVINPDQPILLYGAGGKGREAYEVMKALEVDFLCFVDRDPVKQQEKFCHKDVISPEELYTHYRNANIFVTIDTPATLEVKKALSGSFENLYSVEFSKWGDGIYKIKNKIADVSLNVIRVYHILHLLQDKYNKLILLGDKTEMLFLYQRLQLLDIPVAYGVDIESGLTGKYHDLVIADKFDLLYENSDSTKVLVMTDYQDAAIYFIENNALNPAMFEYMALDDQVRIYRKIIPDPSLGYNVAYSKDESLMELCTAVKSSYPVRIGVLGGSTTDVAYSTVTSWPQALCDILTMYDIPVIIYAGGVSGYIVSQELVKFVRDMSHKNLDILISYSGINETDVGSIKENYFINSWQKSTYRKVGASLNRKVCYGHGVARRDEHWLRQERLLHGMCQELGIKFHAIYQPNLYIKENISSYDEQILDFDSYNRKESIENLCQSYRENSFRNFLRPYTEEYSWLTDFTTIFDEREEDIYLDYAHLTGTGNKILAKKIWQLIKDDVRSIMEERK